MPPLIFLQPRRGFETVWEYTVVGRGCGGALVNSTDSRAKSITSQLHKLGSHSSSLDVLDAEAIAHHHPEKALQ